MPAKPSKVKLAWSQLARTSLTESDSKHILSSLALRRQHLLALTSESVLSGVSAIREYDHGGEDGECESDRLRSSGDAAKVLHASVLGIYVTVGVARLLASSGNGSGAT